jgi:nucleoid-associated protein YgaU
MYAISHSYREHARRWRLEETLAWRARWALLAVATVAMLAFGYAREAAQSPLLGGPVPAAAERVTVQPGDTLWDIASARYPDADTREKVFEIEQLNGLNSPSIQAGQRLRVPAR